MTETENAYFARIIESNGGIILINNTCSKFPSPNISINYTTLELLNHIFDILGKGSIR